ncbi:MAG: hypothetical protein ACFE8E_06650 [Candidatus Hodarchaeota archaeon]
MESYKIGKEAQELDEKTIFERMKINKKSIKKLFGAVIVYIAIMTLFFFLL